MSASEIGQRASDKGGMPLFATQKAPKSSLSCPPFFVFQGSMVSIET